MGLKRKILTASAYLATFAGGFLGGAALVHHNYKEILRYERSCIAVEQINCASMIRKAHTGASDATLKAISGLEK